MKKTILTCLLCGMVALSAAARETVEGSKLGDNWSVGVIGGGFTPFKRQAFWGTVRPTYGLVLQKSLTPICGLGLEGTLLSSSPHAFGAHQLGKSHGLQLQLLHQFNLSNLFGGYKGTPRPLEIVAVYGLGWGRQYATHAKDRSYAVSKAALQMNILLGKAKAWQINAGPALLWNLEGCHFDGTNAAHPHIAYHAAHADVALTAGVTYHFRCSNGTRHFKLARLREQSEIDALQAKINDLQGELKAHNTQAGKDQQTIKTLQEQLNDARNRTPRVVQQQGAAPRLQSVVTFRQGRSDIDASQAPNVERIAVYLQNHPAARVTVLGYASPEGNTELNARLALTRAEAVKNLLVKKYRIDAARIHAEGQGVCRLFSEPDWNRVSIATLEE